MDMSLRLKIPYADDFELCSYIETNVCYISNVYEKLKSHNYTIPLIYPVSRILSLSMCVF